MERIKLEVFRQGDMRVKVTAPGMPEEPFALIVPETIGEEKEVPADKEIAPWWGTDEGGGLSYTWRTEGKVEFSAKLSAGEDTIDAAFEIRNISPRAYKNVFVFTCMNPGHEPGDAASFREPAVKGPSIRMGGRFVRIYDLPAHKGPRAYMHFIMSSEAGLEALPGSHEAFRDHHEETADCGFIASEGGNGYTIAMACEHALFLFDNRRCWCIHACPNVGELGPGEEKKALQRMYITPQGKEEVYERAREELGLP